MRLQVPLRPVLGGLKSYLPFAAPPKLASTDVLASARYAYGVWLRHLTIASLHGLPDGPKRVVELGPGTSLASGFAALLTGASRYAGIDVVLYAEADRFAPEFDAVAALLAERADIPDEAEFPLVRPRLPSYRFPHAILPTARLAGSLAPDRVSRIRDRLANLEDAPGDAPVRYAAWNETRLAPGSVDFVFSQAVMQHVDDLPEAYAAAARWLRPGGSMSHQVDFDCMGLGETWNAHWSYSERTWALIRGRRSYAINREPLSRHLDMLARNGMEIVAVVPIPGEGGIGRDELDERFRGITDEDLATASAHILARKRCS